MFTSKNVAARIFERQIHTPHPGTSVHCARQFYENLVPNNTIYDVECPDHSFRKFTDDGQYLISFSRNHQDLIVYRPTWLSYSCREGDCCLPSKAKRESGNLVDVRAIGAFCHEDDELFLSSSTQCPVVPNRNELHSGNCFENGLHINDPNPENSFLSGIKQRLLSFIFRGLWNQETDEFLRVQFLKKKFYFHFQDYVDLIIWKVQFLDRHHLLIKFGSVDGGVSRSADQHPSFFAVYNMEATDIVAFYQSSAKELYLLFERYCDHFYATSRNLLYMNFISSHSNNIHCREQLISIKNKASSSSQFVKKMLVTLPFSCQSMSPSPYFDQSLFRYDEKLISAIDRHRPATDHPIKFISRRLPYTLKFKIKPGPEAGSLDGRTKRVSSFLFHPFLPLVLSIQQTLFLQPSLNIHFRG